MQGILNHGGRLIDSHFIIVSLLFIGAVIGVPTILVLLIHRWMMSPTALIEDEHAVKLRRLLEEKIEARAFSVLVGVGMLAALIQVAYVISIFRGQLLDTDFLDDLCIRRSLWCALAATLAFGWLIRNHGCFAWD